jgi:CRP-like cAMP-binding protein
MPDASALISGLLETHCTLAPRSCTAKLCLENLTHQVLTPLSPQSPAESVSGTSGRRRSPSPAGSPPLQQSPAGMEGAPLLDPVVHAALKDSVLFGGLTDAELTEVAHAFSPLRCAAGQALLLAGEPNESFFVVASGVFAQYEHHRRRTGPTDQWNLGELPLSPGRGRTGSVFSRGSTDAGTTAGAAGSRGSIGRGSIAAAAAAAVSAAAGSRGSISRSSISRSSITAAGAGGSRNSIAGGSRGSIAGSSRGSIAAAAAASSAAASGWLSPLSADDAVKGGMSQVLCGRGAMFGELNLLLAGALCSKSVVCAMDGGLAYAITRVRLRRVLARVGLRERAEVLSALGGVPLLHQLTKEQLRKLADRVEVLCFAESSQVSWHSLLHYTRYAHACTAVCVQMAHRTYC